MRCRTRWRRWRREISEWTATVAVRETACLTVDDRAQVDAELADRLPTLTPGRVRDLAWGAACRLDPAAAVRATRRRSMSGGCRCVPRQLLVFCVRGAVHR